MNNYDAADVLDIANALDAGAKAIRITRCKDCRYFTEWEPNSQKFGDCTHVTSAGQSRIVQKRFFCAEGEENDGFESKD